MSNAEERACRLAIEHATELLEKATSGNYSEGQTASFVAQAAELMRAVATLKPSPLGHVFTAGGGRYEP